MSTLNKAEKAKLLLHRLRHLFILNEFDELRQGLWVVYR
jgi:hypothetical protein